MIKFDNVNYIYNQGSKYEKKALDNINIEINEHKIIGLIGKSGAGKTTLIQHFNDKLLKPTSGNIFIDNEKLGIVFQYPEHQIFEMTVEEEIGFGLKKLPTEKKMNLIIESLKSVGLDDKYLKKNPFNLSGGEKRRIAIATVLAMDPEILILDEPTVGLDPHTKNIILGHMISLNKKFGKTIIIASHDIDMIYEVADEIILMDNGKIIFYDEANKILNLAKENVPSSNITKLIDSLKARGIFFPNKTIKFEQLMYQLAKIMKEEKSH